MKKVVNFVAHNHGSVEIEMDKPMSFTDTKKAVETAINNGDAVYDNIDYEITSIDGLNISKERCTNKPTIRDIINCHIMDSCKVSLVPVTPGALSFYASTTLPGTLGGIQRLLKDGKVHNYVLKDEVLDLPIERIVPKDKISVEFCIDKINMDKVNWNNCLKEVC